MDKNEFLTKWITGFTEAMIRDRRTRAENLYGVVSMLANKRQLDNGGISLKMGDDEQTFTRKDFRDFGGKEQIRKLVNETHDNYLKKL